MIKAARSMEKVVAAIINETDSPEDAAAKIADLMMELAYRSMDAKSRTMMDIWRSTLIAADMDPEQA